MVKLNPTPTVPDWGAITLATVGGVLTGGATTAGLTVREKVVLTERLPGSVAFTVTVLTPLTEGVPLITLPTELKPAGKPLIDTVNASPLGSANVLAGTVKLNA